MLPLWPSKISLLLLQGIRREALLLVLSQSSSLRGTTAYNAGAGEPSEPQGSSAGDDLPRFSTTTPDPTAMEPETKQRVMS